MSHEDNWDYEAESLMAFQIMSGEAGAIDRRGWDSEQEYQKQVSRIDKGLDQLAIYRGGTAAIAELVGEESADPAEEDLCISAAHYWLADDVEVSGNVRVAYLPAGSISDVRAPRVDELLAAGEAEDLTPYIRELDRAVAEAARFYLEELREGLEDDELEPGEDG